MTVTATTNCTASQFGGNLPRHWTFHPGAHSWTNYHHQTAPSPILLSPQTGFSFTMNQKVAGILHDVVAHAAVAPVYSKAILIETQVRLPKSTLAPPPWILMRKRAVGRPGSAISRTRYRDDFLRWCRCNFKSKNLTFYRSHGRQEPSHCSLIDGATCEPYPATYVHIRT